MSNHQQFIAPSTPTHSQPPHAQPQNSPILPVTAEQAKQMADYFGQLSVLSQQISSVYHQIYHQVRTQPLLTTGSPQNGSAQNYLYPTSMNPRMDQTQVMAQPTYLLPALLPPMPSFGTLSIPEQATPPHPAHDNGHGRPAPNTSGKPPSKKAKKTHDNGEPVIKKRIKPNGFNQFSSHMRSTVKQAYPDLTTNEISKKLGQMWKDLPVETREKYKEEAIKLRDAQDAAGQPSAPGSAVNSAAPSPSSSTMTSGLGTGNGPVTPSDSALPIGISMHPQVQHSLVHASTDDLQTSNAWF